MKILILCTGNSCRSQMAEGLLRSIDSSMQVFSAGTRPEKEVNPNATKVMKEIGIDITSQFPKQVDLFITDEFDYIITVCNDANEACPFFSGIVHHRIHKGFEDPAKASGTEEQIINSYRKVRDQLKEYFHEFYSGL